MLRLGGGQNPLKLLNEFLCNLFIMDDQHVPIILVFSFIREVIRTGNNDLAINDNDSMIHYLRPISRPNIQSRLPEEIERLATWMDTNVLFSGTFDPADQARQRRGERIAGPKIE